MNIEELNNQLDYLEETKTLIKEAIIDKGQTITDNTTFREYVNKIDDIVTVETGTADATAIANDIVSNKTAYANGNKLTGTIPLVAAMQTTNLNASSHDLEITTTPSGLDAITVSTEVPSRITLDEDSIVEAQVSQMAIAGLLEVSANQIKSGETILGVSGKSSIVDTADATATANEIVMNKSAYVNGQHIYGAMIEVPYQQNVTQQDIDNNKFEIRLSSDTLLITNKFGTTAGQKGYINNIWEQKWIPASIVANSIGLDASKLKAGETILGVNGTFTSDANATANTIIRNQTAYVNGVKITGTMPSYLGVGMVLSTNSAQGDIVLNNSTSKITINMGLLKSNYNNAPSVAVATSDNTASVNSYISIDYSKMATKLGITANKILVGNTIIGVTGTATSDADAVSNDIASGKTAYVNGVKITGTSTAAADLATANQRIAELEAELADVNAILDSIQNGTSE